MERSSSRGVADRSSEVPALPRLLAPLDIGGAVTTADALRTQRTTAARVLQHGAHYVLTVRATQAAPGTESPVLGAGRGGLLGGARSWAHAAKYLAGCAGPDLDRPFRSGPGPPDQAHPHHHPAHQNRRDPQEAHQRGGRLPDLLPPPPSRPSPRQWQPGSRATGAPRTACTGYGTPPTARTTTTSAPAPGPRPRPP